MPPAIVEGQGQDAGLSPAHGRHSGPLPEEDTLGLSGAWGCGMEEKRGERRQNTNELCN